MTRRLRGRLRHRGGRQDGGDEPELVEIEPGALARVFAPTPITKALKAATAVTPAK